MADAPITLFIPFGSGYGNPGLTVRSETMDELNALLDDLNTSEGDELSKLNTLLEGVETIKAAVLLKFPPEEKPVRVQASHPQASSTPSDAPVCAHGSMKWKKAVTKSGQNAGKTYEGWFCPAPYGTDQCKPQGFKYL